MSEHNDHDGAEVFYGILKTPYAGWVGTVPGKTNDKKVAEPLIKNYLRRDSAVGATENRH
jgi:hypothetical protein